MIREAILKILNDENLSVDESARVIEHMMSGEATPVHIAAFLTALRQKGETADEISGAALAMRKHALHLEHRQTILFDNCGTGGDGAGTFNISTTAAFVLAGCGLAVGKHGNRSVSSRCGSADLLQALGAHVALHPNAVSRCIDEVGIGFLFAPLFHPAMKIVAPIRKELAFRTIFNLLGPLTNPAFPTHQVIGVGEAEYTETVARAAMKLGIRKAFVVHDLCHVDELTTIGPARIFSIANGTLESTMLHPQEYGFAPSTLTDLQGGTPEENAAITLAVLGGERGPRRDTVLLNAGVSLYVAEKAASIQQGTLLAAESIESGAALDKLHAFIAFTRRFADVE